MTAGTLLERRQVRPDRRAPVKVEAWFDPI